MTMTRRTALGAAAALPCQSGGLRASAVTGCGQQRPQAVHLRAD